MRIRSSLLLSLLAWLAVVPAATAQPVVPPTVPPVSAGRLVAGGLAGGALGVLAGGAVGLMIGGNSCRDEGNPDSCRGLEGLALGVYSGYAIGAPAGVHFANRRRGNVLPGLLVSGGLAALGGVLIHRAERRAPAGEGARPGLLLGVAVGIPVTQLIGSVLLERATTPAR